MIHLNENRLNFCLKCFAMLFFFLLGYRFNFGIEGPYIPIPSWGTDWGLL